MRLVWELRFSDSKREGRLDSKGGFRLLIGILGHLAAWRSVEMEEAALTGLQAAWWARLGGLGFSMSLTR